MTAKVSIGGGHPSQWLSIALLTHGAATLLHFAHNAVFLDDYPNMPSWISAGEVVASWLMLTSLGVVGYLLFRFVQPLVGLVVLSVYALLGFDGFAHYGLAPASAHTATMNATIWLEAMSGALLLVVLGWNMTRPWRVEMDAVPK